MSPRDTLSRTPQTRVDETFVTTRTAQPLHAEPAESEGQGHRIFTTAELFDGDDEIVVLHNGAPYRLRITRQDKLILTK